MLVVFGLSAVVSLGASAILVTRLERLGERLHASEALLGLIAALAADMPEITSAVAAVVGGHEAVGLGVAIGSNVFNLAALLGLGAVVAGRIDLHRRVIELEGAVGLVIAGASLAVVAGVVPPAGGLAIGGAAFAPYAALAALSAGARARLPIRPSWRRWLGRALSEEEAELAGAIRPTPGVLADGYIAFGALIVVVVASVALETSATDLGRRAGIPELFLGGIILAAVTSLPNAVAGVYLAMHRRGAASLSTALNSNAWNALVGFLAPAALLGAGVFSGDERLLAAAWLGLTMVVVALAWVRHGLGRVSGSVIAVGWLAFAVVLAAR